MADRRVAEGMVMRVVQAGDDEMLFQVNPLCFRAGQGNYVLCGADGHDAVSENRNGFGPGVGRVSRIHPAVRQYQIRGVVADSRLRLVLRGGLGTARRLFFA